MHIYEYVIKIDFNHKVPPVPRGENAKMGAQISAGECIGGSAFTNALPPRFPWNSGPIQWARGQIMYLYEYLSKAVSQTHPLPRNVQCDLPTELHTSVTSL